MKDKREVISDFNELVNMTGLELESWLKSGDSNSAGWPKSGGDDGDGESVGHESGRKIVEILKDNPKKDPEKYTDEQVEHMRKVVAYCKRHLAQETAGNNEKSEEDVKKTKSYASLKNWGHDFLKAKGQGGSGEAKTSGSAKKDDTETEAKDSSKDDGDDEENAGSKRKQSDDQEGPSKKRETHKGESNTKDEKEDKEGASENDKNGDTAEEKEDDADESAGAKANGGSKETENAPSKGDTASWKWGSGHPEGKVLDVKGEKASITTQNGNEVSKNGTEEDPAVVLDTGKSKVVKLAHELD